MIRLIQIFNVILNFSKSISTGFIFTPHGQRERGKVIGLGVLIYLCLWTKKNLNRTLAIDFKHSR